MAQNPFSANNQINPELVRKLAAKLLKTPTAQKDNVTRLDDFINQIIEENCQELKLPTFRPKVDSHVTIELSEDEPRNHSGGPDDLWVFGYGSLVWKADFPFASRKVGYIQGYERKFYQNSIDHRGTMDKPGRVVTLLPSRNPNSKVWGVAYRIAPEDKEDVLKHLDFREKNGYQRHTVDFHPYSKHQKRSFSPVPVTIYVANEGNDSFAGHINDLDNIAEQVCSAAGPSGTNREYVYNLANAMRQLCPEEQDEHLFALEKKVREREELDNKLNGRLKNDLFSVINDALHNDKEDVDGLVSSVRNKLQEFSQNLHKRK